MRPAAKGARPRSVAEYIAKAPKDKRAALTKLRRTIKAAAPKAIERISYGMAGFKQDAKYLVYFAYWTDHIAIYAAGNDFIKAHATELKPYVQSKGTIQFPTNRPLPYGLVTKIVKARLAEIAKA